MTAKSTSSAIDAVLLAIIDAYPPANGSATRAIRLAMARKALFGEKLAKGRPTVGDGQALLQIAQEDLRRFFQSVGPPLAAAIARRRGKPVPALRRSQSNEENSARARSRDAIHLTEVHSLNSAEDRLRRKYRKATLGQLAAIEADVETTAQLAETVAQVLELLAQLGVKIAPDLGRK